MKNFNDLKIEINKIGSEKTYTQPKIEILPLTTEATEYLTKTRCFHRETLEAFRLGCNRAGEIVIPCYDENDKLQQVKYRHPRGEMIFRKRQTANGGWEDSVSKTIAEPGGKPILLGAHLCDPREGALVIAWGDYDALAVAQDGVPNVCGLIGGDMNLKFVELQWKFLEQFSEIIFYPDDDKNPETAEKSRKKLDELAARLGKYRCKLVTDKDRFGCKDANELLQKQGRGANRTAVENAIPYPEENLIRIADYQEPAWKEGIASRWSAIDRNTGGHAGGQLTIISGDNGAGKTTAVFNLVANFIREQASVMLWSGELKPSKVRFWFEQICAGADHIEAHISPKTGAEYFTPSPLATPQIRNWYADFFYVLDEPEIGQESFFQKAELAVRRHDCKVIVIDNLMAFTGGTGESYYQAQGDFAQSCKRFAEKWDIHLILVCHNKKENDFNKLPDKDSVEGSKKVTNWADFVFQIWRIPESQKDKHDNADAIFNLCKNREHGTLLQAKMTFEKASKRYTEFGEDWRRDQLFGWESNLSQPRNLEAENLERAKQYENAEIF